MIGEQALSPRPSSLTAVSKEGSLAIRDGRKSARGIDQELPFRIHRSG